MHKDDLKYDPDFPFVVVDKGFGKAYARFDNRYFAKAYAETIGSAEVVDTTPVEPYPTGSVLFIEGFEPAVRQSNGEWWFANEYGEYFSHNMGGKQITDELVRRNNKGQRESGNWRVYHQGEEVK